MNMLLCLYFFKQIYFWISKKFKGCFNFLPVHKNAPIASYLDNLLLDNCVLAMLISARRSI